MRVWDWQVNQADWAGSDAIRPVAVPIPSHKKDGLSDVAHHRPRGWQNFVSRLCQIPWVSRVYYDESAYGGEKVKILNGDNGTIAVRYGPTGEELPLRVETSARGEGQTKLVEEYIKKNLIRRD